MLNGIFRNNRPAMFLFLIAGFIIGAYFILSSKIGFSSADIVSKFQQLLTNQNAVQNKDTADDDNDGLTNAEEKKYGTDINKADTDADGYLDGEEILSGRDPLKKGPDDKLTPTDNKNLTELFNSILANGFKNQDSQSISTANLPTGDLTKQIQQLFLPSPITASQIKISADNSESALKYYLSAVQNIIDRNYVQVINNTKSDDAIYQILASASENTFNELKKTAVPSSLTEKHKEILDTLLILKNIDNTLNNESDPVKNLIALKAMNLLFQK